MSTSVNVLTESLVLPKKRNQNHMTVDEDAICPHSFYNRRFMKRYLKTVFPAGFASSVNQDSLKGRGGKESFCVKGLSPPKPISNKSISSNSNSRALVKESFMAWARGDDNEMSDDLSKGNGFDQKDALDPFTDVAGPYFQELAPRTYTQPNITQRPSTDLQSDPGFTDTLHTIQSRLMNSWQPVNPPGNSYVKELTTRELQLSLRSSNSLQKGAGRKSLGLDRVFMQPSSLPMLVPTTKLQSSLYEKSHPSVSVGGDGSHILANIGAHSILSAFSSGQHGLQYEDWLMEQRLLRGKSTFTASSGAVSPQSALRAEMLDDAMSVEGSVQTESSVVIKMHLAGSGGLGAVVTTTSKEMAAEEMSSGQATNKASKPTKSNQHSLTRPARPTAPVFLAGPGTKNSAENALISAYMAASYEPIRTPGNKQKLAVEIHHFLDMMNSTVVNERAARIETIDSDLSLHELVGLLQSPVTKSSDSVAKTTTSGASGFRFKRAQDPMVFYFRPSHGDWRPIKHEIVWEQAKSAHMLAHPERMAGVGAGAHERLKVMFTRHIDSDLEEMLAAANLGSDPTLCTSTSTSVADLYVTRSSASNKITNTNIDTSTSATISSEAVELPSLDTVGIPPSLSDSALMNAAKYHFQCLDSTDVESGVIANRMTPTATPRMLPSPEPPSHASFHKIQSGKIDPGSAPACASDPTTNTDTTTASGAITTIAALHTASNARTNRQQQDSAPYRSYTAGPTTVLELPGFPVNPPPEKTNRRKEQKGPLRIVPLTPSISKQDEMARHLEQRLLKTRF